jgi:hypothetical protein
MTKAARTVNRNMDTGQGQDRGGKILEKVVVK